MTLLGRILVAQGRHEEAERLLRDALVIREERKQAGHWETAKTASILGAALTGLGRYEEAEPLLLNSYPIIAEDRGETHRRTTEALQRIVNLYEAWSIPAKAAEWRAKLPAETKSQPVD